MSGITWFARRLRAAPHIAALLTGVLSAFGAHAQFPAPLASPNLELTQPAFAAASVRLPDGKLVMAGRGQRVNGEARAYLVRLLSDGTLDTSWNPAPNGVVSALYLDNLGRLYVGGVFTQIAGETRTRLARFDAAGVLDPAWVPSANGNTNAIAAGLAGQVCIGGAFTQVNGTARNRIACLMVSDGSLNTGWDPNLSGTVVALHSATGLLYAGGSFNMVGTTMRSGVARIPLSGAGAADAWNPVATGDVRAFVPAGLQMYLAGSFASIGGQLRRGAARVDLVNGALDAAWTPGNGAEFASVYAAASDGSGGLIVAGSFATMGGQPRNNIARLNSTNGNAVAGWNPNIDIGYANELLPEPNGDVVVAGPMARIGGGEHIGAARVFANGAVDPQFNPVLEEFGSAMALARVPGSGDLVIGGAFTRVNGQIRRGLVRVTAAGAIDPNWRPVADADVRAVAVDAIGRVYVGGDFERIDGVARGGLARLLNTADGALDQDWQPTNTNGAYRMLLRPEGLYVPSGLPTPSGLGRLSIGTTATIDPNWSPSLSGGGAIDFVSTLDGSVIVVGSFTQANGQARSGLAKYGTGATAVLDQTWAPVVTGTLSTLSATHFDNAIYVTGEFSAVDGVPRVRLAKLSAVGVGALDTNWAPELTATQGYGLRLLADDQHLYVGGNAGGGFFRPFLGRYGRLDGLRDTTWRPAPDGSALDMLLLPDSLCIAGFALRTLGAQPRIGFGCLPKLGVDAIFEDEFDD